MALAEVYMDESYDDRESPRVLCIAGYVFQRRKAKEFTREWANYLKRKKLPYFHMVDCAHRHGAFKGRDDCLEIEKALIAKTRACTDFGFSTTVYEDGYRELIAPRRGMPETPYAFALFAAMLQVRLWAERTNYEGTVTYIFEAGHPHQGEANRFMEWMFDSDRIRSKLRYGGHSFLPKETPALHPADMLAWQWRLESSRRREAARTRGPRKDFEALIRPTDRMMDYNPGELEGLGAELFAQEQRRTAEAIDVFGETAAAELAVLRRPY